MPGIFNNRWCFHKNKLKPTSFITFDLQDYYFDFLTEKDVSFCQQEDFIRYLEREADFEEYLADNSKSTKYIKLRNQKNDLIK